MEGYTGRALVVDLTEGTHHVETLPEAWYRSYVGGEGVAMRWLYDLIDVDADALEPQQPLIFATGPLTGTAAPCSGRCVVVFPSPATGTIGAANAGGHFAPALKRAGWDLLLVKGKAEKPVTIFINDDEVEIRDAQTVWGKGVAETEDTLKKELGVSNLQIASIGPAGEKGVLFASIMTDKHRAFGRGGPGAMMGSKNLKAVAVKGTHPLPIADPDALRAAGKEAREELFAEAFVRDELHPFGTPSFYDAINALGILPTKNWQQTTYPESVGKLTHEAYHENLEVKPYACFGCPIACGRVTTIKEGPYAGMHGGGPEYEAVAAFGSKCLVDDLNAITAANHLANDMGLDVISAGQVIATAMEWYEAGLLTAEDTGGLELNWGNAEAVVAAVKAIAHREGVGDLLAQGVKRAADKLGAAALPAAMEIKGLEMPADGMRASKGEAVVLASSNRGADHLRPYASSIDAFGYVEPELGITETVDFLEDGDKGWVQPLEALSMATNMLGVCLFASITLAVKASTWAKLLSTALGQEISKNELLLAGERVINLERLINARLGFDRSHDTLPRRFLAEPAPDGRGEGQVVDLETALTSYYEAVGWSPETGLPTAGTLERLGLQDLD
ncbi:MAG: aldehyde ferredoxin oxidoreductase family protein [Anaerolineales bacterium]